ncbi:murein biosynthesis integral membrane protein MurJ [Helicobacter cappadocius]|uniref:Probable lipid II flippase MurJ n=1 Tax=Helicobacter cappadocius TaxID=3063998 RepID=A0AA90PKW9_9HELI|nr:MULTISPECIES: murein biosynthesis integral membrane protein MurJ [unclassified Helicobacter]MDO7253396.1 murein biosynthesis integral membrane protein MurJ [Helicobacter sp. faydin-H75]MDP2539340.1 murein biosynthesis integral membrane protein MurJ [Helicobacter sp. faydin-H76]
MLRRAFFTNSSGIMCSRVLGFFRDIYTAQILGVGVYSDIFFVAFKFPNLFRRIFGEGAFAQSFLPSFISSQRKGIFSVNVFIIFALILGFFSVLVWAGSSWVTKLLAYGFDEQTIVLAEPIVVINFWYLELVFIVTFFSTILQYKNNFWVSAYNSTLLNICMIIALYLAKDSDMMDVVYILSYGVLCGGIAQILLHFYPLYKLGFFKLFSVGIKQIYLIGFSNISKSKSLAIVAKNDLKNFFKQFLPSVLGSSTAQIASFIDTALASFLVSGSISYLYYANRIFQLPLSIFAIAISTALFPMVAKAIKNSQEKQALASMKKSFWFLFVMLLGCTIGGMMLKNEIIWLLFEKGKFLRNDTLISANVFAMYMIGLLPFGLARVFSLWLYAHKRQGRAASISAISLCFGVICSLVLMQFFQAQGLALAGSLSGIMLFVLSVREFGIKRFWDIISYKKGWFALVVLGIIEIVVLKIFLHFFHIN